jgi:hypothetical protein
MSKNSDTRMPPPLPSFNVAVKPAVIWICSFYLQNSHYPEQSFSVQTIIFNVGQMENRNMPQIIVPGSYSYNQSGNL